jgi:8-oxo-dGTP pyrophosphatase MutT (NUDIX family)
MKSVAGKILLNLLVIGSWRHGQVHTKQTNSTRLITPHIESQIARRWDDAIKSPAICLFDGPMCRLEDFNATPDRLELALSQTSYRIFFGTNMSSKVAQMNRRCCANPLGVSAGLISGDGRIIFGHRSSTVAYYPNRIHPFAGTFEPQDQANVFAAVRRELKEELALDETSVLENVCAGLVEDQALCQPELVFIARTRLFAHQLQRQLDPAEHRTLWSIRADASAIDQALTDTSPMTPVAVATLLLMGRDLAGDQWFDSRAVRLTSMPPSS